MTTFSNHAKLDGVVDIGLLLLGEVDALGIAAAFEVEDAVIGPAVLVVTDELAVGIGGQGGLAGAAEAKEHGAVAVMADVGRAVHRNTPILGRM